MSAPTTNASVTTAPSGTGSNIVPTLPAHAVGDEIRIWVVNSGVTTWSAPAGWSIRQQQASSGNASSGVIGTLLYRRVLSGDTLPLASPTCNLGATVTRSAVAWTVRGGDLEGIHTLWEWLAFGSVAGTSNPVRPPSVTTRAPEMLVHICYGSRAATTAPEQTNYTQVQQVINSGIIVNNVSERTIADQNTALSNQDASPTSGVRWIAMILCSPSPDYPYYRSGSQAFSANATSVTPGLPAGTTANDNRGNKDLIILTAQCAGVAPTVNTPAHWTLIDEWSDTTSGGVTTVRKWRAVYTGTLDRQVNRTPSGEIFAYLSVYHNAHQTIPVGTSATQQNASSTTSTFPALARTGTHATIQATCVADATPTFTAPAGWTERNDSQGVTCADQSFNATGTTASASFTLNSASPTLCGLMEVFSVASVINLILTPASVSITVTGQAPQLIIRLTPTSASISLTTFAPNVSTVVATVITPAPAALSLTSSAPRLDLAITPVTATIAITLFAPNAINGILYDSATDANGTDLSSHTAEVGGGWTRHASFTDALTIQSNRIGKDSNTGTTVYYSDVIPSQLLYTAEADIVDVGEVDRALGVAVYIDTETDSMIVVRRQNRTTVQFLKIVNASPSATLASTTVAFSAGLSRRYTVRRLANNRFEVELDGVVFGADIEIADAVFQSPGRIGIRASNNHNGTGYHIDRISAVVSAPEGVTVTPDAALLALTAFAATLKTQITPTVAGLSVSSFAPALVEAVTPASQSLTLTTNAPAFATGIIPVSIALSTNTFSPDLIHTLTPTTRSLDLTTWAAHLHETATPATASLALNALAPSIEIDVTVQPTTTLLTVTGLAPALRERLTASAALLTLTTFAPEITISADITVIPVSQTLTLATSAPALRLETRPASTSLSLSTFAPDIDISADQTVQPPSVSLTLESFAPELRLVLMPTAATLTLTNTTPTLRQSLTPNAVTLATTTFASLLRLEIQPASRVITLAAFAPVVTGPVVSDVTVTPSSTTLSLASFAPWLFLGFVPASRTYMVESGRYEVEVSAGEYEFLDSYEDDEVLVL